MLLKGQCHEIFDFFHESVPPSPLVPVHHKDRFQFFRKFAEIFAVQHAPPLSLTRVANGKNLQSENFFIIFLKHLWVEELTFI